MTAYCWGTLFPHYATLIKGEAVGVVPLNWEDSILVWDDDKSVNGYLDVTLDLYRGERGTIVLPDDVTPVSDARVICLENDSHTIHSKLRIVLGYYKSQVKDKSAVRVFYNTGDPSNPEDWKLKNRYPDKDDTVDGDMASCNHPQINGKEPLEVIVIVGEHKAKR